MSKHRHCKHYHNLLSIIKEKDQEIAELKKRLQYYENYNSPPPPNPEQEYSRRVKIGRNEACPCGSGKKYKKCCMRIV
ncbi:MAG: SEC-C metal-binding domain-containing protein [Nitrososphaerales archaeon]